MPIEPGTSIDAGTRVLITGWHPWKGHTATVVSWNAELRAWKADVDAGGSVFIWSPDFDLVDGDDFHLGV